MRLTNTFKGQITGAIEAYGVPAGNYKLINRNNVIRVKILKEVNTGKFTELEKHMTEALNNIEAVDSVKVMLVTKKELDTYRLQVKIEVSEKEDNKEEQKEQEEQNSQCPVVGTAVEVSARHIKSYNMRAIRETAETLINTVDTLITKTPHVSTTEYLIGWGVKGDSVSLFTVHHEQRALLQGYDTTYCIGVVAERYQQGHISKREITKHIQEQAWKFIKQERDQQYREEQEGTEWEEYKNYVACDNQPVNAGLVGGEY